MARAERPSVRSTATSCRGRRGLSGRAPAVRRHDVAVERTRRVARLSAIEWDAQQRRRDRPTPGVKTDGEQCRMGPLSKRRCPRGLAGRPGELRLGGGARRRSRAARVGAGPRRPRSRPANASVSPVGDHAGSPACQSPRVACHSFVARSQTERCFQNAQVARPVGLVVQAIGDDQQSRIGREIGGGPERDARAVGAPDGGCRCKGGTNVVSCSS